MFNKVYHTYINNMYYIYGITCTHLTGTIVRESFKLFNTGIFAIAIIIAVIDAASQRHTIVIQALVPVFVFCDVLKFHCD